MFSSSNQEHKSFAGALIHVFLLLPFGSGTRFTYRQPAANGNIYKPMSFWDAIFSCSLCGRYLVTRLVFAGKTWIKQKPWLKHVSAARTGYRIHMNHSKFGKNTHMNMKYLRNNDTKVTSMRWDVCVHLKQYCLIWPFTIPQGNILVMSIFQISRETHTPLTSNHVSHRCHQSYITSCIARIGEYLCS